MKKEIFLLLIILCVAILLRFYKLGEIPNGLYQDETAIGYNAYSILKTGKDEHGIAYPLYFKSFGDWKLPVYIYLTAASEALFGLTPFAVRLPAALSGTLTVLVFYFLIRRITKNSTLALISMALLAVNPWHVFYSRAAFEVSIALLFYLSGFYLFPFSFFLSVLCFILALYTYNLTRLLSPLFFIVLLIFHKKEYKSLPVYTRYFTLILAFILLIPFMSTIFSHGGVTSASGTLITSSAAIQAPLLELKSYATDIPVVSKSILAMPVLTVWKYIQNVISYFSVPFYFINGSSHGNHGIGSMGLFYLFELPFIIIGVFNIKHPSIKIFGIWAVITVLAASLTRDVPHATRSFFILPFMITAGAIGLLKIYTYKNRILQTLVSVLMFYSVGFFLFSYFIRFPVAYAPQWRSQDKAVSEYLGKMPNAAIDPDSGFIYSSLLFYSAFDPETFQKTATWSSDDSEGFSFPVSFGKFKIADPESLSAGSQILTKPGFTGNATVLQSFTYPQRPVVISDGQNILQYPTADPAYLIVQTDE